MSHRESSAQKSAVEGGALPCEGGSLPLSGTRIVSFCHYLQGPAATQYLADMGADVIKVEPLTGAFERHWSGADLYADGASVFFLAANRNCRSLAVDLKSESGKQVIRELIAGAQVVLENYRPGALERLGFGYGACKILNPGIVYASATGYGSSGPLVDKPGQDLLVQARCGLAAATGPTPTPVGGTVIDQHGATLLAMGILAALVKKARTGEGSRVEASLLNAGIDLQMEGITAFLTGNFGPGQLDRHRRLATWLHQAPYGLYPLADCSIVLPLTDAVKLAQALDSPELSEISGIDLYAHRDQYALVLEKVLSERRFDDVASALDRHGIWFAKVQTYADLKADAQLQHNRVFRNVRIGDKDVVLVNHPIRYDGNVLPLRHIALRPGQDSRQILGELGYSEQRVDELLASGSVVSADARPWTQERL